ncbi:hypothetical protein Q8A67_019750 [Cirrhinus molitorella]|uniref:Uncharacterized protein n=1 Tax=Cirrhinus molitorella TaxID=172907 RepID=A0AA88PEQ1_9TELE|nr:hypothetical protein Q8A67_019750 [Cirrhinus molitorella]
MFCNHRVNCRYPVSAPTAANALDLSLGVHLKNLRESWSQWSEGEEERKPFHQQPTLLPLSNQLRVRWGIRPDSPGASESYNLLRLNNTISPS